MRPREAPTALPRASERATHMGRNKQCGGRNPLASLAHGVAGAGEPHGQLFVGQLAGPAPRHLGAASPSLTERPGPEASSRFARPCSPLRPPRVFPWGGVCRRIRGQSRGTGQICKQQRITATEPSNGGMQTANPAKGATAAPSPAAGPAQLPQQAQLCGTRPRRSAGPGSARLDSKRRPCRPATPRS